jgi:5'-3' exonuclease
MGIISFYRWIKKINPRREIPPSFKVDNLFIDLNTLLHDVASVTYGYVFDDPPPIDESSEEMLGKYIAEIKNTFERILGNYPAVSLFICGDGALNAAKLYQNKKRRYESKIVIYNTKGEEVFRGALISPGTKLMETISKEMELWAEKLMASGEFPDLKKIRISDYKVPGEGEHKIGDIIRSNLEEFSGKKNAVVGKDSDLFLICMLMSNIDMILLRLKDIDSKRGDTFNLGQIDIVFRMGEVRDTIASSLNLPHEVFAINFTVISCLFGNDFLPPLLCLNDLDKNMRPVMEIMSEYNKPLVVDDKLDLAGLFHILDMIYLQEYTMIAKYSESHILSKSSLVSSERDDDSSQKSTPEQGKRESFQDDTQQQSILTSWISKGYPIGFSNAYYQFHLNPLYQDRNVNKRYTKLINKYRNKANFTSVDRINAMCLRYVQGMKWVYDYYKYGITRISSRWVYIYPCAPMVRELRDVVGSMSRSPVNLVQLSPMDNFLRPDDQQIATFPPWLLPFVSERAKVAYTDVSSILDMFPAGYLKFTYKGREFLNKEGSVRRIGMHEVIFLPPSDYMRILAFGRLIGTDKDPIPTDFVIAFD